MTGFSFENSILLLLLKHFPSWQVSLPAWEEIQQLCLLCEHSSVDFCWFCLQYESEKKKTFPSYYGLKNLYFPILLVVTTVVLKVDSDKLNVLFKYCFLPFKGLHLVVGGRIKIFTLYYDQEAMERQAGCTCLFKRERNWKIHVKIIGSLYWWPCWENPLALTGKEIRRSLQNQKEMGTQILCSSNSFILFL